MSHISDSILTWSANKNQHNELNNCMRYGQWTRDPVFDPVSLTRSWLPGQHRDMIQHRARLLSELQATSDLMSPENNPPVSRQRESPYFRLKVLNKLIVHHEYTSVSNQ